MEEKKKLKYEYGELHDKKYFYVLDLELTCWANQEKPSSEMEIIEIGIVVLNRKFEIVAEVSELVKPIFNPTLSKYCTSLTGITQEQVDSAKHLMAVTASIIKTKLPPLEESIWCCWGKDSMWLQEELLTKAHEKSNLLKFDTRYIDLSVLVEGRSGLKETLVSKQIQQVLPAHRALPDALSTAKLATYLNIGPQDALVSNKCTFRQQARRKQLDLIKKLSKRTNISEQGAKQCLKLTGWNFNKCRELIKVLKNEFRAN